MDSDANSLSSRQRVKESISDLILKISLFLYEKKIKINILLKAKFVFFFNCAKKNNKF